MKIQKFHHIQRLVLNPIPVQSIQVGVKKKVNNKIKYDYSYYTPLKKIKINPLFQMAPKKKKITLEYDGLTIRGKNLFNIFKSM